MQHIAELTYGQIGDFQKAVDYIVAGLWKIKESNGITLNRKDITESIDFIEGKIYLKSITDNIPENIKLQIIDLFAQYQGSSNNSLT